MDHARRSFLKSAAALPAAIPVGLAHAGSATRYRRIAIEEAFVTPQIADAWIKAAASGDEPGYARLAAGVHKSPAAAMIRKRLTDLGTGRIRNMDETGIDVQVLSIAAPGVQVFDAETAHALSVEANDVLGAAIASHPDRYAGLATIAPHAPEKSAVELDRAMTRLGMRGALINSHTKGEYLDDKKFWPIFEALQELAVPLYLHPRSPSPQILGPFLDYGLYFATWGFKVEAGLHAMRLLLCGVFDEFPKLKIILGHMGEGIPFWLDRIDGRYLLQVKMGTMPKMRKLPSEYFKDNFVITTSGVLSHPALELSIKVIGAERILFAVDYPFEDGSPAVAAMDAAPISESEREKIYAGNSEQLFGLAG